MARFTAPTIAVICFALSSAVWGQQGNVGIGVDTPQTELHVAGKITSDSLRLPHGAANGYILTSDSLGNGTWQRLLDLPPGLGTLSETFIAQDPFWLVLNDSIAFVAHHQIGDIRSYDITGGEIVELDLYNTGSFPRDLVLNDHILCGIDASLDSLMVLDVSDPQNITRRDAVSLPSGTRHLSANGSIAAMANFLNDTFYIADISNPDSIFFVSELHIDGFMFDVEIVGDYAYVAEGVNNLFVIDISSPATPVISDTLALNVNPAFIRIVGDQAFVMSNQDSEVEILDISAPSSPEIQGSIFLGSFTRGFDAEGNYLYVALSNDSISVIDISDPTDPQRIRSFAGGPSMTFLEAYNSLLYLLDQDDNFLRILSLGSSIPMLGPDGEIVAFDNTLNGLLEIISPIEYDHLRLTKPGVDKVDMTIDNQDGLRFESNSRTLLYSKLENGYLGIDTRLPREKLTVSDGKILLNNLENTDNKGLLFSEFSALANMGIVFDATDSGGLFEDGIKKIHFKRFGGGTFDTAAIMTVTDEDFVGIRTTNPQAPLHVIGSAVVEDGVVQVRSGLQGVSLVNHASSGFVQLDVGGTGHSSDDIILGDITSPTNKVGIGTSTPGSSISNAMLEVGGGHIVVSNNFGFFSNDDGGSGIGAGIDTRSDDGMEFYANGSSRMTLLASGKLGIGTTNPSETLDIEGGLQVDGATFNVDETNNRVGIGTTVPSRNLEVSGSSSTAARITNTGSGTVRLEFKRSGSDWRVHNTSGILYFGQSSDDLATVTDVLRIGGGTVTPASTNSISLGSPSLKWTTVYATNGTINTSDSRLKKDIEPVAEGLQLVNQLNPVSFKWKDDMDGGRTHTGFLAQELQEVVPHLVIDHEWREVPDSQEKEWVETEHLGVNYAELIPILTKAIQEQQEQIDRLEQMVEELLAAQN